ncbi:hypothetical protein B0H17DRAFT_1206427 [Mycena rosella]|uniref:Uncharacterized protein n=1 Tax=Mycena rosella TaxID=1033263 RepID=A0AAD7GBQ9_MYCRO|nr:hypothetical protein B0H17DRAFT_1206427 [Mycena rosella]
MVIHRTQHDIYGTVMYLRADKHECTFLAFPPQGWLPGSKANPVAPLLPALNISHPGPSKASASSSRPSRRGQTSVLPVPVAARIDTRQLRSGGLYAPAIALGALKLHHLDFAYYMTAPLEEHFLQSEYGSSFPDEFRGYLNPQKLYTSIMVATKSDTIVGQFLRALTTTSGVPSATYHTFVNVLVVCQIGEPGEWRQRKRQQAPTRELL